MEADLKKIRKLIKIMRSEGVLALKQGEIEISLAPAAFFPKTKDTTDKSDTIATEGQYNEDELIDWSNISAGIEASQ